MVKINKTLGLALLTALAAGCSSDNDVAQAPEPVNNNGSAAYATLRIDLPTQQGSRAVEEFNDGLDAEYHVNDATLLVFKKAGSSEGEYTFVESVDLQGIADWTKQSKGGITTTADLTAKLTVPTLKELTDGNYYGLVILNNGTDAAQKIKLPDVGTTFSTWNNDARNVKATNMLATSNGFVMANAPEWTATNPVPTTLVQINGANVRTTAAKAKDAGPAAEIHVERGLAKVTMESLTNKNPSSETYKEDKVTITDWALDVTNKSSFPVHKIDGLEKSYSEIWNSSTTNRFLDHTTANSFKRVYWGIDPNYDGNTRNQKGEAALNACKEAFNMVHDMDAERQSAAFKNTFGGENPQYCLENTFNLSNMTQGQTTRVLLKATYNYKKNDGSESKTFYKFGSSSKLYTATELEDALKARYHELNPTENDVTVTLAATSNDITKAGVHELKDANFSKSGSVLPTEKITTYENGVCYYIGRIRHFDNVETPWNRGESYGTNNQKYLGRYGVLRNNWYNLKVNSVVGPGEPEIPEVIPENPDDDDTYIDLSVKILQWAKHSTQELDI
jgi:hypothetical protein